ncbi:MAG: hypothetical protein ACK5HY_17150, partial [Parahaliea sp.]
LSFWVNNSEKPFLKSIDGFAMMDHGIDRESTVSKSDAVKIVKAGIENGDINPYRDAWRLPEDQKIDIDRSSVPYGIYLDKENSGDIALAWMVRIPFKEPYVHTNFPFKFVEYYVDINGKAASPFMTLESYSSVSRMVCRDSYSSQTSPICSMGSTITVVNNSGQCVSPSHCSPGNEYKKIYDTAGENRCDV